MRWMQTLIRLMGNEGAVRNVKSDMERRASLLASIEALAVHLALVEPAPPEPVHSAEAA